MSETVTQSGVRYLESISIAGPWITQKEIDYVTDAVSTAWYSDANKYHERFERKFANYVGRKHAVALPSCTAALHLSLMALGVSTGDEIIVPDSTWIATSAPISYLGATPVFADVDQSSWCISVESVAKKITNKTKGIICVDLYGNMPDMDKLSAIAKEHGLFLVEDAAEAVGSMYKGKMAGSFGAISTFSFHGSKTLTTGEGGMLLTDDDDILSRVLTLRDHGRDASTGKMFWNSEVGYKYKMSSMQAALGLAQIERIEELVSKKREIFSWYQRHLQMNGVQLNNESKDVRNTYWMITAIWDDNYSITKETLIHKLSEKSIASRPFFYPLSSMPAYPSDAHLAEQLNPVAYQLSKNGINLPSNLMLTEEDVKVVCREFEKILADSKSN